MRDGYGQTETTAQVGNPPGAALKPGSMGRPLPGYEVLLLDPVTGEPGDEGELCLPLDGPHGRPVGLMVGYRDDHDRNADAMRRQRLPHRGRRAAGRRRLHHLRRPLGRRVQGLRLPDQPLRAGERADRAPGGGGGGRRAVPGADPARRPQGLRRARRRVRADAETAAAILEHARGHLAPYKRIRRIEFADLPKTISGKIRRVELRAREVDLHGPAPTRRPLRRRVLGRGPPAPEPDQRGDGVRRRTPLPRRARRRATVVAGGGPGARSPSVALIAAPCWARPLPSRAAGLGGDAAGHGPRQPRRGACGAIFTAAFAASLGGVPRTPGHRRGLRHPHALLVHPAPEPAAHHGLGDQGRRDGGHPAAGPGPRPRRHRLGTGPDQADDHLLLQQPVRVRPARPGRRRRRHAPLRRPDGCQRTPPRAWRTARP